jgi:hypothetical protein
MSNMIRGTVLVDVTWQTRSLTTFLLNIWKEKRQKLSNLKITDFLINKKLQSINKQNSPKEIIITLLKINNARNHLFISFYPLKVDICSF